MDLSVFLGTIFFLLLFLSLKLLLSWRSDILPTVPLATGNNFFFGNIFTISKELETKSYMNYIIENTKNYDFGLFHVLGPGMSVIVTCESEHLEMMYSKEYFDVFVKGEVFKELFEETLGEGIFVIDGEGWKEKRKVSSHLFSSNSLRHHMSGVFCDHTNKVIEILEKADIIDIQDLFSRYTFDSIASIAFGMDVNSLGGAEKDLLFQKSYDIAQAASTLRFVDPLWKVKKYLNIGLESQLGPHVKRLDEYIYKIIEKRLEEYERGEGERGDMLSLCIEHGKKRGKIFDKKYLRDMILNFLIAGRDTTAVASMWIIYELANNPEAEEKLLGEMKEVLGDGEGGMRAPGYDDLLSSKMPFLRAVIFESLRLHPSVPLDGKIANRDCYLEPGHIFIKKGTEVDYNIYMMNRNPKQWGPDANLFRPERWIKNGKFIEKTEKEYPVFNVKPRGCLGKRMAELEAGMLVVGLVPRLRFEVLEREEDMHFAISPVLFLKGGMKVRVKKRE